MCARCYCQAAIVRRAIATAESTCCEISESAAAGQSQGASAVGKGKPGKRNSNATRPQRAMTHLHQKTREVGQRIARTLRLVHRTRPTTWRGSIKAAKHRTDAKWHRLVQLSSIMGSVAQFYSSRLTQTSCNSRQKVRAIGMQSQSSHPRCKRERACGQSGRGIKHREFKWWQLRHSSTATKAWGAGKRIDLFRQKARGRHGQCPAA